MQVLILNAINIFTGLSISQVYASVYLKNVNALILCQNYNTNQNFLRLIGTQSYST